MIHGGILNTLTEEQKKKVEAAQTPENLLALAKEFGHELTVEQLDAIFSTVSSPPSGPDTLTRIRCLSRICFHPFCEEVSSIPGKSRKRGRFINRFQSESGKSFRIVSFLGIDIQKMM